MPASDDSDLKKYIAKLEARIETLEKAAEERVQSGFGGKWFKRAETKGAAEHPGELRMVLMGPPGAGSQSNWRF
jgi:hypothetical protein